MTSTFDLKDNFIVVMHMCLLLSQARVTIRRTALITTM